MAHKGSVVISTVGCVLLIYQLIYMPGDHHGTGTSGRNGSNNFLYKNVSTFSNRNDPESLTQQFQDIARSSLWENASQAIIDCINGQTHQLRSKYNPQHKGHLARLSQALGKQGENEASRKASFSKIFTKKLWGGTKNTRLYGSGPGSTLERTANIRRLLAVVIDQLKVILHVDRIRMLDIPCGDMAWMPVFLSGRSDVDYTGMDIVPAIIDSHREYFKNNSSMSFVTQDVVKKKLNKSYDLIFTRQMTQHLTTVDTVSTLYHFERSGSRFLLATTAPHIRYNRELTFADSGWVYRFRLQNLMISPYWLRNPVCLGWEQTGEPDVMALWKLPFT